MLEPTRRGLSCTRVIMGPALGVLLLLTSAGGALAEAVPAASNPAAAREALAQQIQARVEQAVGALAALPKPAVSVTEFEALATTRSWTEIWPRASGTGFEPPYTILTVCRMRGDLSKRLITSLTHNWLLGYQFGKMDVMYAEGWVAGPTREADTAPHIYTGTGTGQESAIYRDGTLVARSAGGTSGIGRLCLGGRGTETSNGDVAEVVVYSRVLGDPERRGVEAYLQTKWLGAPEAENGAQEPRTVPGLAAWLKADDLQARDGEKVARWTDASGQGSDLAQADAALQPTLAAGALGGKNVVRFTSPSQLALDEVERAVAAQVWNAPIQAALAKHGAVFLPKRDQPYYLNEPIVLKSGQRLVAAPQAEIRLIPNTNTCMIRNEHVVNGKDAPIPQDAVPDTGILIEGGIWTTLATTPERTNGNNWGFLSRQDQTVPAYGVILLSNVRGAVLRNLVVRESGLYALQVSNCRDFLVEHIRLERHRRDGVHVNGPSSYGVIRDIGGQPGDDLVALNAWDWAPLNHTFGQIDHVLVEDIQLSPTSGCEVRLLPGTKTFANGRKLDCPVTDCVLRDIRNIVQFKLFDQPCTAQDFCDPIGTARNVYYSRVVLDRALCIFQVGVNVEGLYIDEVQLGFDPASYKDYRLVDLGPKQYSPNRDVTIRGFHLTNVTAKTAAGMQPVADAETSLVKVTDQSARGGTGKAIVLP